MEGYSTLLGWKNQYCENDYTPKSNIQIQCNPYQIINGIFHRIETKNFTIRMETKAILRKKDGAGRVNSPDFNTTKLQSSRQYGTVTKIEVYPNG